jgi:ferredoxin, 2Fe-2S
MNLAEQNNLQTTMTRILFIQPDGREQKVDAKPGQSVMQAAIGAVVPGIVADCGGACTCATCHGYVDRAWSDRVPPPSADEVEMIDAACLHVQPTSRLTCQIKVTPEMEGLVVRIPPQD